MAINKRKLTFEINIEDDVLRNAGFEKISINSKDMVTEFVHSGNKQHVLSKFNGLDDLTGTLKNLQNVLVKIGIDEKTLERLDLFLTEKLLEKQKELQAQNDGSTPVTELQKILDEIEKDRKSIGRISIEEWQAGMLQRYEKLKKVAEANFPTIWVGLEFALSAKCILNIKDCTLPFAGVLLAPPSSLKTLIIEQFRKWPQTYYTDNFSARSFVSHSTAVSSIEELEQIDMLPKIKNKLFLTPELAPMFAAKDDDLLQLLSIITRILDGHGYESDSGAHGHRGYNGEMMFVWIGAAVDIPFKVYRFLGTLGPKLYFLRLPKVEKTEDEYIAEINCNFAGKVKEIEKALLEYLKWFELHPTITEFSNTTLSLQKIEWNASKDANDAKKYVVRLARLLSYLRGVVPTWHTRDTQGSNYGYGMSIKQQCDRAITQLYNLARGHALSQGRFYITLDDIPLVIKVVLSTASIERVTIFDLLLAHKGTMTTTQIANSLNISKPTALRTMTELKALGLVQLIEGDSKSPATVTLIQQFNWVFDKEFLKLREGFVPSDNSEHMPTKRKEKSPLTYEKNENNDSSEVKSEPVDGNGEEAGQANSGAEVKSPPPDSDQQRIVRDKSSTQDVHNAGSTESASEEPHIKFNPEYEASRPIFWRVFEELANCNTTGLVNYDKLQERLIASGKFFAGEAILMIEHMEKIGEIEQTDQFHMYTRIAPAAPVVVHDGL